MPVYDYACEACGPFTVMRPMAEFREPHACPDCGAASQRAFLTAPRIGGMDAGLKAAHATNERSRHAPGAPAPTGRLRLLRAENEQGNGSGRCQELPQRATLDDQPLTVPPSWLTVCGHDGGPFERRA